MSLFYLALISLLFCPQSIAASSLLAIDAGHSKTKSGATSAYGETEFSFNTALATTISDALVQQAVNVLRIGHDGDMIDLTQRTALANNASAAFFLSIHHDSVQPQYLKSWQWQGKTQHYSDYAAGFSLFVSRKNPQLASSLRCASAIGSALKQQGFQPSAHHAEKIAGENRAWADEKNGVYYFDDLIVLKTATMPAVLLEAGVIVNRQEAQYLQQTQTRTAIASAIETALKNCAVLEKTAIQ
jgi:N-acetylmuramoyl-L-alanine amidase